MDGRRAAPRYPILLIHGTGVRDPGCWGRIPDELRRQGAAVYLSGQDGWATVEDNAIVLKRRAEDILRETGCEKLHLIAHSKGGLEARYLVSSLGMADRVASVTTIATPHRGSRTMDALIRLPGWAFGLMGAFVNGWYRLTGDRRPDFRAVCRQFTTAWAAEFNAQNPDVPGVLYRACAGAMASPRDDLLLWWQYLIIRRVEGENDGLVTLASARWTGLRPLWRGASHLHQVDLRRRPVRRRGTVFDPVEEYLALAAELKELGL